MKKTFAIIFTVLIVVAVSLFIFVRSMHMGDNTTEGHMGTDGRLETNQNKPEESGATPLPIPPELKDMDPDPDRAEFYLTAEQGTSEFIEGKETETLGYNGGYLGPLIRVREGEEVSVKVENQMDEDTTVHWHGLEIDGKQDGGPHTPIFSGEVWNPQFTIEQPAATLWYHPHLFHKTGEQVYKGLAGLFYIEDDVSDSLDIPKEYGVDDIPLIIQDKDLDSEGRQNYDLGMHDIMMGLQGDTILVNGAKNPYVKVPQGIVRFRLLNGSNARIYDFQFSGSTPFYQIASDGGFLEEPVEMSSIVLSSAERAEILVDFSEYSGGDIVYLTDEGNKFMAFTVTGEETDKYSIPDKLTDIPKIDPDSAVRTREFSMDGMGRNVNINGKQMDMERIDEEVNLGDTEIWEISNDSTGMMGGMVHPFHAHGVQFQILDRDGNPPPPHERGWKDTILIYPGEKVRVIATFNHQGVFMYHCHILEHEDSGMMGQFIVQ